MAWVNIGVELEYDRDIAQAVETMGEGLLGVMGRAVLAGAEVIREAASQNARRKTGKLSENMVVKVRRNSGGQVIVVVGPDKDAFYGRFLEIGTSKMPAYPFLLPAFEQNRKRVKKQIMADIFKELGL